MKKLIDILEFVSKDTIIEKLDINKTSMPVKRRGWLDPNIPEEISYYEIIWFLERNRFIQKPYKSENLITQYVTRFNKYQKSCFETLHVNGSDSNVLIFADTSKEPISDNNPLYFLRGSVKKFTVIRKCVSDKEFVDCVTELTEDEFVKDISKKFGWR